jgi:predicted aconitase
MASYGSTPMFHIVGITPEAPTLATVCDGDPPEPIIISADDIEVFRSDFSGAGEKLDVVVFAAPQLSLVEMRRVADLLDGQTVHPDTALIVCTAPTVASDCDRMGLTARIEASGAKVLRGTCFYNQYAREIGEANGWKRLLSNSAKLVNIISGYGYQPALASMEACVTSAVAGKIL